MKQYRYLSLSAVQEALNIGRSLVYQMFNRADFPTVRLGRKLLVRSDKLDEWLSAQNELTKTRKQVTA